MEQVEGIPDLSEVAPVAKSVATDELDISLNAINPEPHPAAANLPMLVLKSFEADNKVVTIENVKPEHLASVDNIGKMVDFGDSNSIIMYATKPQEKVQAKLMTLLKDVKVRDFGGAGDLVLKLTKTMDYLKVDELKAELVKVDDNSWKNFLAGVPLIGGMFSKVDVYMERRSEIVSKLMEIKNGAEAERRKLIADIASLDQMFISIEGNFYELGVYVVAGEKALLRGQEEFENLRRKASKSGNALEISAVNSLHENLLAFDDTLLELKMAYIRAPITGERIRLIQRVGRDQIRKISHDLLFTMTQLMEGLIQLNTLLDIARSQANAKGRDEALSRIAKFSDEMLVLTTEKAHANRMDAVRKVEEIEAQATKALELMRRRQEMDQEASEANRTAEKMLISIQTNFREGLKKIVAESPIANKPQLDDLGIPK